MAGHVETKRLKSGNRYYPVIVYEGKRHYHKSHKTRKNAEAHLRRLEDEVANGTYGVPKEKTLLFCDWADNWLKGKEKSLKPGSWVSYESAFRLHILPYFGKANLKAIDPESITEWIDVLCHKNILAKRKEIRTLSPATVNRTYRYFRACMRSAYIRGHIDKNPCRGIDLPRVEKGKVDFLQPEEVARLLDATEWPEKILFFTIAYSGLRLGEALALRWRNIDFKNEAIVVEEAYDYWGGIQSPKTATSVRAIPLLPTLLEVLEDHRSLLNGPGQDELLFSHNGRKPLDPSNMRKRYDSALRKADLRHVTIHSLRHTFASCLIACGGSVKAVQVALGHSTAMLTLDTYGHLMPADLGDAAVRVDALLSDSRCKVVPLPRELKSR